MNTQGRHANEFETRLSLAWRAKIRLVAILLCVGSGTNISYAQAADELTIPLLSTGIRPRPGQGWDSALGRLTPMICLNGNKQTEAMTESHQRPPMGFGKATVSTAENALESKETISGKASGNGSDGPFSAKGSGSFLRSLVRREKSISIVTVQTFSKFAVGFEVGEKGWKPANVIGINDAEIRINCGTHYVREIRTGGEFILSFNLKERTKEERINAQAKIAATFAGVGGGKLSGEQRKNIATFSKNVTVETWSSGPVKPVRSVQEAIIAYDEFFSNVEKSTEVVEVVLGTYPAGGPTAGHPVDSTISNVRNLVELQAAVKPIAEAPEKYNIDSSTYQAFKDYANAIIRMGRTARNAQQQCIDAYLPNDAIPGACHVLQALPQVPVDAISSLPKRMNPSCLYRPPTRSPFFAPVKLQISADAEVVDILVEPFTAAVRPRAQMMVSLTQSLPGSGWYEQIRRPKRLVGADIAGCGIVPSSWDERRETVQVRNTNRSSDQRERTLPSIFRSDFAAESLGHHATCDFDKRVCTIAFREIYPTLTDAADNDLQIDKFVMPSWINQSHHETLFYNSLS